MSEFRGTHGPYRVYVGPMNMNGGLNPFFKGIVALLKHSGEDDDVAIILDRDEPAYDYEANAHMLAASWEMFDSIDPETLEAIADEIGSEFHNSARADSLRIIARKQRAAIAKALGEQP